MGDEADPLQLPAIGINPVTASLAESIRFPDARDWIGQTAANSAMGSVRATSKTSPPARCSACASRFRVEPARIKSFAAEFDPQAFYNSQDQGFLRK
jgi:hypothetical protein